MIVLTAVIQAKPGKEQELENLLTSLFPQVSQEVGVIEYKLHSAQSVPGKFFFYEKYKDQQTLDRHSNTPYLQDVFNKMDGLVSEKPQVELYEEIASIADKIG
ncbi:MAG: Antibiotic biosynthesis monooxygenase [Neobacillus sp.]|nr:Antibiotic biosynthesis monooxygenase [Neobacillus sp.]